MYYITIKKSRRDGKLSFVNMYLTYEEADQCATAISRRGAWRGKVYKITKDKAEQFLQRLEPPKKTPYYRCQPWEYSAPTIKSGDVVR